jgi:hypothetical protein
MLIPVRTGEAAELSSNVMSCPLGSTMRRRVSSGVSGQLKSNSVSDQICTMPSCAGPANLEWTFVRELADECL